MSFSCYCCIVAASIDAFGAFRHHHRGNRSSGLSQDNVCLFPYLTLPYLTLYYLTDPSCLLHTMHYCATSNFMLGAMYTQSIIKRIVGSVLTCPSLAALRLLLHPSIRPAFLRVLPSLLIFGADFVLSILDISDYRCCFTFCFCFYVLLLLLSLLLLP